MNNGSPEGATLNRSQAAQHGGSPTAVTQATTLLLAIIAPTRRQAMQFRKTAAMLLLACATAAQAAYPEKPIRLVIGFPAGGPLDQHARLLSERLQAVLGQPLVIDYKAGAGGTVGAQ